MKKILTRRFWQGITLITITVFAFLHTLDNVYPSAHSLCPFGGLASLYSLITTGTFVHRVHGSALFLLLAVVLVSILAGRFFCGWLCPLGTIGEWVNKIGKKLGIKKQWQIPEKVDRKLRLLKYIVLVLVLYLTWTAGSLIYKGWCPWSAFMTIFEPAELIEDVLMGGVLLLGIIGLSLFIERFFCKYFCPMGAAIAVFNRLSIIKPVRKVDCLNCKTCEAVCPSGVRITENERDLECIRCYQCIDKCPEQGSLRLNFKTLSPYVAGLLAILVFAGTLFVSYQAGFWEKGRTFINSADSGGTDLQGVPDSFLAIKASASLYDVAEIAGLPLETVCNICNIPTDIPPELTIREINGLTGITRGEILKALSNFTGGP